MDIETYKLPAHWACALINGDESGLDDDDAAALDRFTAHMTAAYGHCWAINCDDDAGFETYHDARPFGVLACDTLTFYFDVTPR